MQRHLLRAELLLLIAAAIWGFAFVAQRSSMEHIGPFTFNGIRFLTGAVVLIPIYYGLKYWPQSFLQTLGPGPKIPSTIYSGIMIGVILFLAASLQQTGLLYTTAGNAGFITGLYIIFVPIIGIFAKQTISKMNGLGIALAFSGLVLLSSHSNVNLLFGDLLQLIGAIFWALHIIAIGKYSPKTNAIQLCIIQFSTCGLLSLLIGIMSETITFESIYHSLPYISYTGILSTAVAFTLQVVAQKKVPATHAAIIFSLESVFALLGGWLLLNEKTHTLGLIGCCLMLLGVIVSQLQHRSPKKKASYH